LDEENTFKKEKAEVSKCSEPEKFSGSILTACFED
jgi:hypothetical protein